MSDEPQKNPLCDKLSEMVRTARTKRWKSYYDDIAKNRRYASGRIGDDDSDERLVRANVLYSTKHRLIQHIYARAPDVSVSPSEAAAPTMYQAVRGFAKTGELVLNQQLIDGGIKSTGKLCVDSAMTSRIGWAKVTYQRDFRRDPVIHARIADAQDNLARLSRMAEEIQDPSGTEDQEAKRQEIEALINSLQQQVEVLVGEGLVIDFVRAEDMTMDPALRHMSLIARARWLDERIWMPREEAESLAQRKLDGATVYEEIPKAGTNEASMSGSGKSGPKDGFLALHETWWRQLSTVYTWCEGEKDWVRPPYSPDMQGEQWDPYFPIGFYDLDGEVLPMSLTEQLRELQDEYNGTRTQLAEHREISIPHWIADKTTDRNTIERYRDAALGEIVIVDANGQPLSNVIQVATPPPFNPALYDTNPIRADFDWISGLSDANRSSIAKAKTATEAEIANAGFQTDVGGDQDVVEDWLLKITKYSFQVLLQELTLQQVQRIAGPNAVWPEMNREEIYDMVNITIRAGSTAKRDKFREREDWIKLLPVVEGLIGRIVEAAAAGLDPSPQVKLLELTLHRFDERLDVEEFLPAGLPMQGIQPQQGMPMGGDNVVPINPPQSEMMNEQAIGQPA